MIKNLYMSRAAYMHARCDDLRRCARRARLNASTGSREVYNVKDYEACARADA